MGYIMSKFHAKYQLNSSSKAFQVSSSQHSGNAVNVTKLYHNSEGRNPG